MNKLKNKPLRIGDILVQNGVLTEQQAFEIAQAQRRLGLPFGVLAEQMFEVTVESIEQAWVQQYHQFTGTLDLATCQFDEQALRMINRRQAWQFEILPIGFEPTGELLMAASRTRLARAVTFATNSLDRVVYFRIAESDQLREFLQQYYPIPGVAEYLAERTQKLKTPA